MILTDVDGVLLNWEHSFHWWMRQNGYKQVVHNHYNIHTCYGITAEKALTLAKHFNASAAIGFLPPLRDAVHYVRYLHEHHGIVFHAISSMGLDHFAHKLRKQNLYNLFGKNVFEKITILDCGEDKTQALMPYKDSGMYWIEDRPQNANLGTSLGLTSVLFNHPYNKETRPEDRFIRVNNWKDLVDKLFYL